MPWTPRPPAEPLDTGVRELVAMLTPGLGREISERKVAGAMQKLGFRDGTLTREQRRAVLAELSREPGMVGVTARFAVSRDQLSGMSSTPPSSAVSQDAPPSSGSRPLLRQTVSSVPPSRTGSSPPSAAVDSPDMTVVPIDENRLSPHSSRWS